MKESLVNRIAFCILLTLAFYNTELHEHSSGEGKYEC